MFWRISLNKNWRQAVGPLEENTSESKELSLSRVSQVLEHIVLSWSSQAWYTLKWFFFCVLQILRSWIKFPVQATPVCKKNIDVKPKINVISLEYEYSPSFIYSLDEILGTKGALLTPRNSRSHFFLAVFFCVSLDKLRKFEHLQTPSWRRKRWQRRI